MCFLSRGADLVRTPFFTLPPKAKDHFWKNYPKTQDTETGMDLLSYLLQRFSQHSPQ